MLPFRVIVIDGNQNQTTVLDVPFDRVPGEGEMVSLPHGDRVIVRHVISADRDGLAADRDGLAGIVLAGPASG